MSLTQLGFSAPNGRHVDDSNKQCEDKPALKKSINFETLADRNATALGASSFLLASWQL